MKPNLNSSIQVKPTTPPFLIAIALVIACFVFLPKAQAVVPAPDGGYPGGNTAEGQSALSSLTNGGYNAAVGYFSLFANTTGSFNTAVGAGALDLNNAGSNTAVGAAALLLNTSGSDNTAVGTDALGSNHNDNNTAVGSFAGSNITSGFSNVAVGAGAGGEITTGNDIIAIGAFVSGVSTPFGERSSSCYIGNIYGQPVDANDFAIVVVDGDGKLGTFTMDANGNSLTVPTPRGVHPEALSKAAQPQAMLNRKLEKLHATVAQQQKQIETLTAQIKEQAEQIQQVSAQLAAAKPSGSGLELSKAAPQIVLNNH